MRLVPTLLISALLIAPFGYLALSLRWDSSRDSLSLLSSSRTILAPAIHHAPGISGHWGGDVVAVAHRAHNRATLAGSVTSWSSYLYGSLANHAEVPSASAAAPVSSLPAVSAAAQHLSASAATAAGRASPRLNQQRAQDAVPTPPPCVLQPSLFSVPSRSCPRVFSPVCGCNGVVYR
jgi:hypothetical protein